MRSCWSCNTDGENLGCSWADYDPSTPAEMLNKNSRFDNVWSNLIQIPEWETIKSTEFTARKVRSSESSSKNPCRHYNSEIKDRSMIRTDYENYCRRITTPLQVDYNANASRLQRRSKLITGTITSWLQAAACRLQELLRADYKPWRADYGSIT